MRKKIEEEIKMKIWNLKKKEKVKKKGERMKG